MQNLDSAETYRGGRNDRSNCSRTTQCLPMDLKRSERQNSVTNYDMICVCTLPSTAGLLVHTGTSSRPCKDATNLTSRDFYYID